MFCNNSENVTRANIYGKKNRKRKKHSSYPRCDKKPKQTDQSNSNLTTDMSNCENCSQVAGTWQFKHEVAFWKSRAKSLEYENKILHNAVKKLYLKHFAQPTTSSEEGSIFFDIDANGFERELGIEENDNDEDGYEDADEEGDEEGDEEYDEDNDDNFEVSEEFLEFLKQNAKHKEDALKEKEELKAKLEAESKELLMDDENLESSEDKRNRFMDLYGAEWEKIMALETSSLCHFINECDKEKPKYWPNIPLNFDCC